MCWFLMAVHITRLWCEELETRAVKMHLWFFGCHQRRGLKTRLWWWSVYQNVLPSPFRLPYTWVPPVIPHPPPRPPVMRSGGREANRRPLGFRSSGTHRTLDPHTPPSDLRLLLSLSSRRRPTLMLLHVACSSASVPDWLGFGFLAAEAETTPPPPQGLAPEGPSSRGSPHPPPLRGKRRAPCSWRPLLSSIWSVSPDFPGCLEQSAGLGMSCFGGVRIYAADFGGVERFEVEMFRGFPPVQYGPSCTNACRPLSRCVVSPICSHSV